MHRFRRVAVGATAALALTVGIGVGGAGAAIASPTSATPGVGTPSGARASTTPSLAEQDATADHVMGATSRTVASSTPRAVVGAPTVGLRGFDVSYYQGAGVDYTRTMTSAGGSARFVFVKATEGTPGTSASGRPTGSANSYRASQYAAARAASITAGGSTTQMMVGTYHYALPYYSSGATQARFFLANTPATTRDAQSLPPVLDMEVTANPTKEGGSRCWGLSSADMVSWIQSWVGTVVAAEGVQPLIYTNQDFWNTCTGNSRAFPHDRLYVASYPSATTNSPVAPTGLGPWTFWQWSRNAQGTEALPGNQDVFNGSQSGLRSLAEPSRRAVGRLAGGNAYATAANIAASAFSPAAALDANSDATAPGTIPVAYVATRSAYPDALSAAAAAGSVPSGGPAGSVKAPVLLTDPNSVPAATAAELRQLRPQRVVVVGGTSAVSTAVQRSLGAFAVTGRVTRLQGTSRYGTSAAISAATFSPYSAAEYPNGLTAYVATGTNFPDALAGAAVAAGTATGPMLLVKPTGIDPSVAAELRRLHPTRIVILGGTSAVSAGVQAQLASSVAGGAGAVTRWAGANRFDTSVVVAQRGFGAGAATAFLATGTNFPDALAGAPAAGVARGPVLLTRPDAVPSNVLAELGALGSRGVVVLGGPAAVSAAVEAGL